MAAEQLILVDAHDRELGAGEKLEVHLAGALHRAFSVFVFDRRGRLLMQQRAREKYHSAGLWSNTACGHPRPGEATAAAARRRLREEMGFDCELREAFEFVYRAELGGALVEHEYDHVFVGTHEGDPAPDPSEVEGWRWVGMEDLRRELREEPQRYSYWLKLAVEGDHWRDFFDKKCWSPDFRFSTKYWDGSQSLAAHAVGLVSSLVKGEPARSGENEKLELK